MGSSSTSRSCHLTPSFPGLGNTALDRKPQTAPGVQSPRVLASATVVYTSCGVSGVAVASRSARQPVRFRTSTKSSGGSTAPGEGPMSSSGEYRDGDRDRGCRTGVAAPDGSSAATLHGMLSELRADKQCFPLYVPCENGCASRLGSLCAVLSFHLVL